MTASRLIVRSRPGDPEHPYALVDRGTGVDPREREIGRYSCPRNAGLAAQRILATMPAPAPGEFEEIEAPTPAQRARLMAFRRMSR